MAAAVCRDWCLGQQALRSCGPRAPVLFVPSTNIDIVSVGDTAALTCGSVLAAVDLDEACEHQLRMAARLAALAHGPLLLMTVAQARMSEHDANQRLRERAHELAIKPHANDRAPR